MQYQKIFIMLMLMLILSSCGGGGGGSPVSCQGDSCEGLPPVLTFNRLTPQGGATRTASPTFTWVIGSTSALEFRERYGRDKSYEVALGTTAGGTQVLDWSSVGIQTRHQVTGLSLEPSTDYYFSVRITGLDSSEYIVTSKVFQTSSSGSQPSPILTFTSLTFEGTATLSASPTFTWVVDIPATYQLQGYEVAIGTTSGGTEVLSWRSVGIQNQYQVTGLTLSYSTDYYFSVRAVDSNEVRTEAKTRSNPFWITPPTTQSYYLKLLPYQVNNALDIQMVNLDPNTHTTWQYSIADMNNQVIRNTGSITSSEALIPNVDISSLADGDLTVSLQLTNSADSQSGFNSQRTEKNTMVDKRVAILFFNEEGVAPDFTTDQMKARFTNEDWSAKSILKAISLGKESFGTVDTFGWYPLPRADLKAVAERSENLEFWLTNSRIVNAVSAGNFNPTNYDIFYIVIHSTSPAVFGNAAPQRREVTINSVSYGSKHIVNIYGDRGSLFNDQCFFSSPIYRDPDRCYDNPQGSNYARVDATLVHEYLHTKGVDEHSTVKQCSDSSSSLLGICLTQFFNSFDVLGSDRFFGNSLNSQFRNQVGWGDSSNTLVLEGLSPLGTLASTQREVTLYSINKSTTDGYNSLRIDFNEYFGDDLWFEYHTGDDIDYALSRSEFENVLSGLLVYKGGELLDASPPGLTPTGIFSGRDVTTIGQTFSLPSLGVNITNITHLTSPNRIRFNIEISQIRPTRTIPTVASSSCNDQSGGNHCSLAIGSSLAERYYRFSTSDIGYASDVGSWVLFSIEGLPEGVTYTNTPIQRRFPSPQDNVYSGTPHTFITFSADDTVTAVESIEFTVRVCNASDATKCQDISQYLSITN